MILFRQTVSAITESIRKRIRSVNRSEPQGASVLRLVRLIKSKWFIISTPVPVIPFLGLTRMAYRTISADLFSVEKSTSHVRLAFFLTVNAGPTRDAFFLSPRQAFLTVQEPCFTQLKQYVGTHLMHYKDGDRPCRPIRSKTFSAVLSTTSSDNTEFFAEFSTAVTDRMTSYRYGRSI